MKFYTLIDIDTASSEAPMDLRSRIPPLAAREALTTPDEVLLALRPLVGPPELLWVMVAGPLENAKYFGNVLGKARPNVALPRPLEIVEFRPEHVLDVKRSAPVPAVDSVLDELAKRIGPDQRFEPLKAFLRNALGEANAPPLPEPLFTCTSCGAQVFYQKEPGPCPSCGAPQPN